MPLYALFLPYLRRYPRAKIPILEENLILYVVGSDRIFLSLYLNILRIPGIRGRPANCLLVNADQECEYAE